MTRIPEEGTHSEAESASGGASTAAPTSAPQPGPPSAGTVRHLTWLALFRLGVSFAVSSSGLIALSDDDYARVTIAQRFAKVAHLDPSGTSWLPFPFWIMGGAMKVLDPSLDVARLVTHALAVAATCLVYATGRIWGFSEKRAFVFAVLVTIVPAVAVLGSVMVPELPTASLALFAVAAVSTHAAKPTHRAPWLGSAAIFAASLSRYETWPIAATVAALLWQRTSGAPLWKRVVASASALLGPALWIAQNRAAHGDAFSFLRRVATYRAALGEGNVSERWGYVIGLVSGSPAVMLVLTLLVVASLRAPLRFVMAGGRLRGVLLGMAVPAAGDLRRFRGFAVAAAALFLFLVVGQWAGGAPTHHPERTLLFIWIAALLAVVDLTEKVTLSRWVVVPAALLLMLDYQIELRDRGALRQTEERLGTQLRSLVSPGERVFAATRDYGYFAVMAAFARPDDVVFDSHDPRVESGATLLGDPWNAVTRLRAENASWLVAPSNVVWPLALRERSREGPLVIYELDKIR